MTGTRVDAIVRRFVGHPALLRGIVLRVALIWFAIRAALFGVAMLLRVDAGGSPSRSGLVLVIVAIVLIDARVTRELLYLRNLGLSAPWLAAVTALAVLAFESALRVAL